MSTIISSYNISNALMQSVLTAQTQLANAEQEEQSGTYADVGLELGENTNQDLSLYAENSELQSYQTTNNLALTRLSSTASVLTDVQSTAQDFLDSLISYSNDTGNPTGTLQQQAENALSQLSSQLNTSVDGQYLFAGINTSVAPMTSYTGTAAQTSIDTAFNTYLSGGDAGITAAAPTTATTASALTSAQMQDFITNYFTPLFNATNWSANWSTASNTAISSQVSESQNLTTSVTANATPFQELSQAYSMISELGSSSLSSAAYSTLISNATSLMQSAVNGLNSMQTTVGATQSDITTANSDMSAQSNVLTTQINNLESVNPYAVSTQISDLQTQIETAYSLTSQLSKLSLVNYI